jgi:hypothetical protein
MATNQSRQSTPAWLYTLLDWLRGTPLQGWLVALIIFAAGLALMHLPYWTTGRLKPFEIEEGLIFPATWLPVGLIFWLWQDFLAGRVINDFSRGVGKSAAEAKRLYAQFVSVPGATALVLILVGVLSGFLFFAEQATHITNDPLYIFLAVLSPALGNALELLAVWRWGRQLIQVNHLYKGVKHINLFALQPIYSLSRYGYSLALLVAVGATILDLINRLSGGTGLPLENILYQGIIALAVFLIPLFGISSRIRAEKAQELHRLGTELNSVYNDLESSVHSRKLARVPALQAASIALKEQMETVQKVATWPWNPGSLRKLLLPVLLPLFLAVLQRYLLIFLGL